nr:hypothetical protein [Arcanobacterium buesumense]
MITYRPKSAIRDCARALGYDHAQIDSWTVGRPSTELLDGVPQKVVEIAQQMQDLPRHVEIHSGGMVLCDRPVIEVCHCSVGNKTRQNSIAVG